MDSQDVIDFANSKALACKHELSLWILTHTQLLANVVVPVAGWK